jgi:hypothetical protein
MPEHFDLDEARRALDAVPAPDLWDEAQRRAADGSVVTLVIGEDRARHRGRWLAVAAAAALVIGAVAVLASGGDQAFDTTPATQPTTASPTTVVVGDGASCRFGVSGDPLALLPGSADPPLFDQSGQPGEATVVHARLGPQVAEVQVPGLVLIDLVSERVEPVELRRGMADLWFGPDFVQVRWFGGAQEPCESFTVTVAGGDEDGNRHAAVDLADRLLLPSDLGDLGAATLAGTRWQLDRSTVAGVPTDGNGSTFTFHDAHVTWMDGCNTFDADFTQPSPTALRLGEVASTALPCPFNPTSQAISAVMSSDSIEVAFGSGRPIVVLTAGDTVLTLVSVDEPQTTTSIGPLTQESTVEPGVS